MQIIWLGHASFKIVAEGQIIYIDPYAGEDEYYEDIANIILVSHSHVDHCDGRKRRHTDADNRRAGAQV